MGSTYVAQLLPDADQARVLRDALKDYTERTDITEDQRDAAWELLAKLTADMRRHRG